MENNTKSNQGCGCEDGSCKPKKKPSWVKYLSIPILLAAISIVAVKVIRDKKQSQTQCTSAATGKSCCNDSSKTDKSDTTKGTSCCTKEGN